MNATYCYWSVATGEHGTMMGQCVRTAREAGVFKEFHVLTDRPLQSCECYDAFQCDKADGLFKLHYLKAGMTRLLFDYFIWIDADTVFMRNPLDVLAPLGKSPIHVPLELNLATLTEAREWKGVSCFMLRKLFREKGISNQPYLSRSAFWIINREAIDTVYELALRFWNDAKESGTVLDVDNALGFAMQILCGNPEAHRLEQHPELWATDELGLFGDLASNGHIWRWQHPLSETSVPVRPAIVHLGRKRGSRTTPLVSARQ